MTSAVIFRECRVLRPASYLSRQKLGQVTYPADDGDDGGHLRKFELGGLRAVRTPRRHCVLSKVLQRLGASPRVIRQQTFVMDHADQGANGERTAAETKHEYLVAGDP